VESVILNVKVQNIQQLRTPPGEKYGRNFHTPKKCIVERPPLLAKGTGLRYQWKA